MDDKLRKEINDLLRKLQREGINMVSLIEHESGLLHIANSGAVNSKSEAFSTVRNLMEVNGNIHTFLRKVGASFDDDLDQVEVKLRIEDPVQSNIKTKAAELTVETNEQVRFTQH